MLTLTIGTFAIALNHLLLIAALILATFVGWRVAKRGGENPESVLFNLFLLGMLAADPASGLPPETLFLMGRLAEHHACRTAEVHRTLTRSWRKVRGRRWRALRARLAELSRSAAPGGVGFNSPDDGAHTPLAGVLADAIAPELLPIKH